MLQFYFLSILCNASAGYVLFKSEKAATQEEHDVSFFIHKDSFRLGLGIVTCVTAILKILSVIPGDVRVIGDFIPAFAGLLVGFILVFGYYRNHSDIESEKSTKLALFFETNRKWIGIAAMVSAALHFLFPTVMFL